MLTVTTRLPEYQEATELLTFKDENTFFQLQPDALDAWLQMKEAAAMDGIHICMVSAFRSVARQTEIIEEMRANGISDEEIFVNCAPPGQSEHHTGRAVDVGTEVCTALETVFRDTAAFRWLTVHAHRFDFHMSFPIDNVYGIRYEPWHWCYRPNAPATPQFLEVGG